VGPKLFHIEVIDIGDRLVGIVIEVSTFALKPTYKPYKGKKSFIQSLG
jgi:hypothetical protein